MKASELEFLLLHPHGNDTSSFWLVKEMDLQELDHDYCSITGCIGTIVFNKNNGYINATKLYKQYSK
jgi:hypothetical protein